MDRVVWFVNSELPQIAAVRGRAGSSTCGWISGAYDHINETFELFVIYPVFRPSDAGTCLEGPVKYAACLHSEDDEKETQTFAALLKQIRPDLVDVWGTEFNRSHNAVLACERTGLLDRTLVSMQGSAAEIAVHYPSNLSGRVLCQKTFRDLLRRDSIRGQQKKYEKRALLETDTLRRLRYCIGKTDWDEAVCRRANPAITYFRCCEILRDVFYENRGRWRQETCVPHSILLCQGNYPIKGLHIVLEAVSELKGKYPDIRLVVTGTPPYDDRNWKSRLKTGSYGAYIRKLVRGKGLEPHVVFAGMKNAEEMAGEYLSANAVVLASSVENESNSVSEAHMLGVPVAASFSGGVSSRVTHGFDGYLFSYDDARMLAWWLHRIFSGGEKTEALSRHGVETASALNDRAKNNAAREAIYRAVIDGTEIINGSNEL